MALMILGLAETQIWATHTSEHGGTFFLACIRDDDGGGPGEQTN